MNVIQIGSLTLQGDLLALMGSGVLAAIALSLRMKLESRSARELIDWLIGLVIALVLNMKFGYLWDSPSIIWEQPKAMLFLSGTSTNGNILLALGLFVWTTLYVRKHQIPKALMADGMAHGGLMGLAAYGFFYAYMNYPAPGLTMLPLPATMSAALPPVESIVALILLLGLWIRRRPIGSGSDALGSAFVIGLGGMLLSYFSVNESQWLGLSLMQWIYLGILVGAYTMLRTREQLLSDKSILMQQEQAVSAEDAPS